MSDTNQPEAEVCKTGSIEPVKAVAIPPVPTGQKPINLTIMVDTETWGLKPNAVIGQLAFMAALTSDLSEIVKYDSFYLPIQPQLDAGRTVDASTILFWFRQPDESRLKWMENDGGDSDTLVAYVRAFIRKVDQTIQTALSSGGKVEIIAKGPQFDIVKIENLIQMCGEIEPWEYSWVSDLRTLMKRAEVHTDDVKNDDIVPHIALEDCRLQLRLLEESETRLGLR